MPSTQHIAASPMVSGSRRCAGSRAYVHHSLDTDHAARRLMVSEKVVFLLSVWRFPNKLKVVHTTVRMTNKGKI